MWRSRMDSKNLTRNLAAINVGPHSQGSRPHADYRHQRNSQYRIYRQQHFDKDASESQTSQWNTTKRASRRQRRCRGLHRIRRRRRRRTADIRRRMPWCWKPAKRKSPVQGVTVWIYFRKRHTETGGAYSPTFPKPMPGPSKMGSLECN